MRVQVPPPAPLFLWSMPDQFREKGGPSFPRWPSDFLRFPTLPYQLAHSVTFGQSQQVVLPFAISIRAKVPGSCRSETRTWQDRISHVSATLIVRGWTKQEHPWAYSRNSCDTRTSQPQWTSTATPRPWPSARPIGQSCNAS